MASRDQTAYVATIDPDRLALKRCANESYDIATRQGVGAVPQVGKIEAYLDTYVRAYVQEGALGLRRMFLHSHSVSFEWPRGEHGGLFSASAPLPAELSAVVDALTTTRKR